MNASQASVQRLVTDMTLSGISERQMVLCLLHLVPVVGRPRVTAISPKVSLALGYDTLGTGDES